MLKQIFKKLISRREVIIRHNGEVKYISLEAKQLGVLYAGVGILTAAVLFSGYSYYDLSAKLDSSNHRISGFENTIAVLTADFSQSQSNLKMARTELDQQYDRIEKVITERASLHKTLQSLHADLTQTKFDRNDRAEYATTLESKIGSLTNSLASVNAYSEGLTLRISRLNRHLNNVTRDRDSVIYDKEKLVKEKFSLLAELSSYRQDKKVIYKDLLDTRQALTSVRKQYELSKFDGIRLSEKINGLNSALASAKSEREDLVSY